MRKRRILAAAAAGFGSAALLVLPFAGRAPADTSAPQTLPIYALHGIGSGVELTLAPKPEVLDPLVDVALMHVETAANAGGGGSATGFAGDVYPGAVVMGGAGCQPAFTHFGIAQSSYPPTSCSVKQEVGESAPMTIPPNGTGPFVLDAGHAKTESHEAHTHATVTMNKLTLAPASGLSILVDHMTIVGDSLATATTATQTVSVSTNGVHITTPALSLDITSMVSKAVSISDGTTGTTDTSFTIGDAIVTIAGQPHRVTIDNTGVHLADLNAPVPPVNGVPLPSDVRQPLSQQLEEALAQSDLIIRGGTSSEITNGPSAESSIGGLLISFESGRPPAVPIPAPIAQPVPWPGLSPIPLPSPLPTIDPSPQGWPVPQFQPICPGDIDLHGQTVIGKTGLCVGQGLVPVPPGDVLASVALGGADASATAAGSLFPGACSTCGTTGGLFGGGTTGSALGGGTTGAFSTGGTTGSATGTIGNTGRLFGLVARLPSAALAGAGAALLVLAVGLAAGPSLRP